MSDANWVKDLRDKLDKAGFSIPKPRVDDTFVTPTFSKQAFEDHYKTVTAGLAPPQVRIQANARGLQISVGEQGNAGHAYVEWAALAAQMEAHVPGFAEALAFGRSLRSNAEEADSESTVR